MADQNPQHGRRQHFHRGRRGQDRRGNERRGPAPSQAPEQGSREPGVREPGGREHRDHVDVEQIMREIRSRISQRHGIELSTQQIQELAARRLEAILDPRTVKPSLLEQIRRSTSTPVDAQPSPEPAYSFEDTTLYDTPRGSLKFIRRLLNPLLKLFFNPNPLISALHTQVKLNQAAVQREAERDRRQAEWNALHYEILQRLVLEIARTSLDAQQLALRVDALSAKVEFGDRRARSIEGTLHQARPAPRHGDSVPPVPSAQITPPAREPREQGPGMTDVIAAPVTQDGSATSSTDSGRRRRRRRRGRRPQGFTPEGAVTGAAGGAALTETARAADAGDAGDIDEPDEDDGGPDGAGDEGDSPSADAPAAVESAAAVEVETFLAPVEPSSPPIATTETPAPAETVTTPQSPSAESVTPELPDRPLPPDGVGD